MARDLDAELIESVKVRRRRLREAFLGGSLASRRAVTDNVLRAVIGLTLAAVICAGCAATSFIRARAGSSNPSSSPSTSAPATTPTPAATPAATP